MRKFIVYQHENIKFFEWHCKVWELKVLYTKMHKENSWRNSSAVSTWRGKNGQQFTCSSAGENKRLLFKTRETVSSLVAGERVRDSGKKADYSQTPAFRHRFCYYSTRVRRFEDFEKMIATDLPRKCGFHSPHCFITMAECRSIAIVKGQISIYTFSWWTRWRPIHHRIIR